MLPFVGGSTGVSGPLPPPLMRKGPVTERLLQDALMRRERGASSLDSLRVGTAQMAAEAVQSAPPIALTAEDALDSSRVKIPNAWNAATAPEEADNPKFEFKKRDSTFWKCVGKKVDKKTGILVYKYKYRSEIKESDWETLRNSIFPAIEVWSFEEAKKNLSNELLKALGYSYSEKKGIIFIPEIKPLVEKIFDKNSGLLDKHPNLKFLKIILENGIATHDQFLNDFLSWFMTISEGVENIHDHFFHLMPRLIFLSSLKEEDVAKFMQIMKETHAKITCIRNAIAKIEKVKKENPDYRKDITKYELHILKVITSGYIDIFQNLNSLENFEEFEKELILDSFDNIVADPRWARIFYEENLALGHKYSLPDIRQIFSKVLVCAGESDSRLKWTYDESLAGEIKPRPQESLDSARISGLLYLAELYSDLGNFARVQMIVVNLAIIGNFDQAKMLSERLPGNNPYQRSECLSKIVKEGMAEYFKSLQEEEDKNKVIEQAFAFAMQIDGKYFLEWEPLKAIKVMCRSSNNFSKVVDVFLSSAQPAKASEEFLYAVACNLEIRDPLISKIQALIPKTSRYYPLIQQLKPEKKAPGCTIV